MPDLSPRASRTVVPKTDPDILHRVVGVDVQVPRGPDRRDRGPAVPCASEELEHVVEEPDARGDLRLRTRAVEIDLQSDVRLSSVLTVDRRLPGHLLALRIGPKLRECEDCLRASAHGVSGPSQRYPSRPCRQVLELDQQAVLTTSRLAGATELDVPFAIQPDDRPGHPRRSRSEDRPCWRLVRRPAGPVERSVRSSRCPVSGASAAAKSPIEVALRAVPPDVADPAFGPTNPSMSERYHAV